MRWSSLVSVGLVAAVAAFTGCADPYLGRTDPVAEHVERFVIPVPANAEFDLLFVVDNSSSMAGEQAALAAMPEIRARLAARQAELAASAAAPTRP